MFTEKLHGRFGAAPLSTHYDGTVDSRVELPGTTFSNWVDKTVNMLDSLGVGTGEPVYLGLMNAGPGYWVITVWVTAIWQRDCPMAGRDDDGTVLAVAGPVSQTKGPVIMMCSLHPLGLGLANLLAGYADYAGVLAEPDVYWGEPAPPNDLAWLPNITRAGLKRFPGSGQQLLFANPPLGWENVRMLLVPPVLGDGSTIVTTGTPPERVSRVVAEEKVLLTRVGEAL